MRLIGSYLREVIVKIRQDNLDYKPITITLETGEEAEAFFNIVDEYAGLYVNSDKRHNKAYELATDLSNVFTDCRVEIPVERSSIEKVDYTKGEWDKFESTF